MISLLKSLIAFGITLAMLPTSSFAQDATDSATAAPTAATSATTPAAATTPAPVVKKKKRSKKAAAAKANAASATAPTTAAAPAATPAPTTASAPTSFEPSQGAHLNSGETLNFKTEDAAPSKDAAQIAPVYTFKDSSEPMQASPVVYNDALPDDTPFKTYVGYPKNVIEVSAQPKGVAANWSYQDKQYNFRASTTGLGLAYNFVATPRFGMGVDYTHSSLSVGAAQTNDTNINSSTANFDTYFVRTHYCFFGNGSFQLQYCPEFVLGNDAYPVLNFLDNSTLALTKVQDLVLGLAFRIQVPVNDRILIHFTPGYNMGTGIGNSGALTSKYNSTLYALLGATYDFNHRHAIGIEGDFASRSAKLSGNVGTVKDEWVTKSTDIGAKISYILTL